MKTYFLEKTQDWDKETTTYWFTVEDKRLERFSGEKFGVVHSPDSTTDIVDAFGGDVINIPGIYNIVKTLPSFVTEDLIAD